MTESIDVTYHGDIRFAVQTDPFRYPGLPDLPLGIPVNISEEYINAELSKYGVVDWGIFLFDPEYGFFNEGLPAPRVTMTVHVETNALQEAADLYGQLANAPPVSQVDPLQLQKPNDNPPVDSDTQPTTGGLTQ